MRHKISKFRALLGTRLQVILAASVVVGLVVAFIEIAFAFTLQAFLVAFNIAEQEVVQIPDWIPQDNLNAVLLFLFFVTAIRGLLQWLQAFMKGLSQEEFKSVQRQRILEWVFHSPSASSSRVTTLFNERTQQASLAFMYMQIVSVYFALMVAITLYLFRMNWQITLMALAAAGIIGVPMTILNRKIKKSGTRLAVEWDKTNTRLMMGIKNLLLLRIYDMVHDEERLAKENLSNYRSSALQYNFHAGFFFSAPQILGIVIICGIALYANEKATFASGVLLSYFYLFVRLMQTVSAFGYMLSGLNFQKPQMVDLMNWYDEHQVRHKEEPRKSSSYDSPFGWRLHDVGFCYEANAEPVLWKFNQTLQAKHCCVIMGPSGAGKSTLLGLLLGQITPSEGSIELVQGGDVQLLPDVRGKMLNSIGYVGAESFLIEGTVLENITFGLKEKPDPDVLEENIRLAECQFISSLRDGLNHKITEQGAGLSAGQKQRLGLLRALMRQPKALILDEATANLDFETEDRLIDTLGRLKEKMTIVIVTHRPAARRIADTFIQLGQGQKSAAAAVSEATATE